MRSTAYDAYWNSREQEEANALRGQLHDDDNDDEMLCYYGISRICAASKVSAAAAAAAVNNNANANATSLETSWNGMLLEFSKRRREGKSYPLWNIALEIASHARREEYYVLWGRENQNTTSNSTTNATLLEKIPVLAKSILSSEMLLPWRYRTVQHYNLCFGKGEMVSDMNRLLGIDFGIDTDDTSTNTYSRHVREHDTTTKTKIQTQITIPPESSQHHASIDGSSSSGWSIEYAKVFGLPVEEEECTNGNSKVVNKSTTIRMKLKHVAMPEFDYRKVDAKTSESIRMLDRRWTFGKYYDNADTNDNDNSNSTGLSSEIIGQLLEFGSPSPSSRSKSTPTTKSNGGFVNTSTSTTCFDNSTCILSHDTNTSTTSDDGSRSLNVNDIIAATTSTSLSRALALSGVVGKSNNRGNSMDNIDSAHFFTAADTSRRPRLSPLRTALDRIQMEENEKKKKKVRICRFFRTSKGCRLGDNCHFEHALY